MNIDLAVVTTVEDWFRTNFPDHNVESAEIFDRMVVLFRTSRPRSVPYELEISYEAFQDHDADTIVGDLDRLKAAQQLKEQPKVRLTYNRQRQLVETDRYS